MKLNKVTAIPAFALTAGLSLVRAAFRHVLRHDGWHTTCSMARDKFGLAPLPQPPDQTPIMCIM
jgi:hypothetical protein